MGSSRESLHSVACSSGTVFSPPGGAASAERREEGVLPLLGVPQTSQAGGAQTSQAFSIGLWWGQRRRLSTGGEGGPDPRFLAQEPPGFQPHPISGSLSPQLSVPPSLGRVHSPGWCHHPDTGVAWAVAGWGQG